MFCYSGMTPEQVDRLTKEYHIYMTRNGRIRYNHSFTNFCLMLRCSCTELYLIIFSTMLCVLYVQYGRSYYWKCWLLGKCYSWGHQISLMSEIMDSIWITSSGRLWKRHQMSEYRDSFFPLPFSLLVGWTLLNSFFSDGWVIWGNML